MAERADIIPNITTPEELAETLGVSPRRVRDDVRALGCYCKIGRAVIMREHHVNVFMEAMECLSKSTSVVKSGTTGAPLPEGDYAALVARRTKKSPKESRRKQKQQAGVVTLMDRART